MQEKGFEIPKFMSTLIRTKQKLRSGNFLWRKKESGIQENPEREYTTKHTLI